jgi:hypothetical protein
MFFARESDIVDRPLVRLQAGIAGPYQKIERAKKRRTGESLHLTETALRQIESYRPYNAVGVISLVGNYRGTPSPSAGKLSGAALKINGSSSSIVRLYGGRWPRRMPSLNAAGDSPLSSDPTFPPRRRRAFDWSTVAIATVAFAAAAAVYV